MPALEIGCGLGLAGLVALGRGWHVTFTDYDEGALEFVRRSAAVNGFEPATYATRRLDWRDPPDQQFPVILGADVLYECRLVPLVANLLALHARARRLRPDRGPLSRGDRRVSPARWRLLGLNCADEPIAAQSEEQGSIRGTLYRVWR